MDYKEKYDKLVEAIKALQEANPSDGGIQNWVNDSVPELKESEDERIRKELLDFCKNRAEKYSNDPKYKNISAWIAWLEKQGEKECTTNVGEMLSSYRQKLKDEDFNSMPSPFCKYNPEVYDGKSLTERSITIGSKKAEGKLGEMLAASKEPAESREEDRQLSQISVKKSDKVWSEEDQNFFGMLEGYLEFDYDLSMNDKANTLDWLKSIKSRVQPQPKQEWGKEDEMSWENAIEAAVSYFGLPSETVNWLKSLKQRMS